MLVKPQSQNARVILWHALPVSALVLTLFYIWYGLADRYVIFLYYHDMGPLIPDTSPFSVATAGRYWMAGLVAGGAVMVLYSAAGWLIGRLIPAWPFPMWWQVWLVCAGPLLVGLPLLVTTLNQPTLPVPLALWVTLVTLAGLALALVPGRLAAQRPVWLFWLALDGLALGLMLTFAAAVIDVPGWWAGGQRWRVWIWAALMVAGPFGLFILTGLRRWLRQDMPSATALFLAGIATAYLLLPLVHHLFVGLVEGYFYITTADNFFARTVGGQIVAWLLVGGIALALTRLRYSLLNPQKPATNP